jgi:hypothetical protein
VVALAVLVASGAAFFTPVSATTSSTHASSLPSAYTATTVLWNTGAPTIVQGSPITSMDALATIVTLPSVASIAAQELHFGGGPVVLSSCCRSADPRAYAVLGSKKCPGAESGKIDPSAPHVFLGDRASC